jgi:Xaa-Pro aminopeptidase
MMAGNTINALREWIKRNKLDAYLIPHADRFQSEYLPAGDERLAWATGFTGSAGMAAILDQKAALFTDGRYTLQAGNQVDTSVFDIVEAPPASPMEWLSANLASGATIGFDPMLFTVAQIALWTKAATPKNIELVAIEENPIDLLWNDKPVDPIIPAEVHDMKYAGQSTSDKIASILEQKSKAAHHILISDPSLVCWLLNMRGRDVAHTPLVQSVALLDETGQVTLFTDPKKITPALHASWGNHVSVENLSRLYDVILKINQPLQIDPSQCMMAIKLFCNDHQIQLIESTDPSLLLRACKNAIEIAGAEQAHQIDLGAFKEFREWFATRDFDKEVITELDIVQKLHETRLATGQCVDESFDTIAGFGPNGAIVHYRADEYSNLRLIPNNLLLLDSGGQYRCGTTDVTRVLPVGTPTAQMKDHYTAVLKGLIALSRTRFPVGTTGAQLDAIARAPIWAMGLDYAHGTGHGVGSYLSVHEGPQGISSRANSVGLKPGMILSIEPGIYLNGEYGIRLENLVVVINDPCEGDLKEMLAFKTLTKFPFESIMIQWDALDHSEIEFLKTFETFPS